MTDRTTNARTIGFTLARLGNAVRGLPREAPVLIRTPNGALKPIDHVTGVKISEGADGAHAVPEGQYAIVLVLGA